MRALSDKVKGRTASIALLLVVCGAFLVVGGEFTTAMARMRPTRIVIITGIDESLHHWKETSVELKTILEANKHFRVTIETDPNFLASDQLFHYDAAVFDFRNKEPLEKDEQAKANLLKFLSKGKGIVTVHWADGAFPYWPEYPNIVGRSQVSHHDPRGPFTVKIGDNSILRGMHDFQTDDELYYDFKEGNHPINILATAHSKVKDKDFPMALTVEYGGGRVFNTPLGHDVKALQVPEVGELIRRGTAWAAGDLK